MVVYIYLELKANNICVYDKHSDCAFYHGLTRVPAGLTRGGGRPRARAAAPDERAGLRGVVAHVDAGHGEPYCAPAHACGEAAAVHDAGRPVKVAAAAAPCRQPGLLRLRAVGGCWPGAVLAGPGCAHPGCTPSQQTHQLGCARFAMRGTALRIQDIDVRSHINNNPRHAISGSGV